MVRFNYGASDLLLRKLGVIMVEERLPLPSLTRFRHDQQQLLIVFPVVIFHNDLMQFLIMTATQNYSHLAVIFAINPLNVKCNPIPNQLSQNATCSR